MFIKPLPVDDLINIVKELESDLHSLQNAKIFITGASGFFGTWIVNTIAKANQLLSLNISTTLLSRSADFRPFLSPDLAPYLNYDVVIGDVRNFESPSGVFTHVIHAATTNAEETFKGELAINKYRLLLDGTNRVIDFCREKNVKKILFTSSGVVYGQSVLSKMKTGFNENDLLAPDISDLSTALGQGKRAAEFALNLYSDEAKADVAIARCFSFVGPGLPLDLHYAIGNFIKSAICHEDIVIQGDGTPVRSYLYVGDLMIWLFKLLINTNRFEIFNVGSGKAISIKELAVTSIDLLSPENRVEILAKSNASHGNPTRNVYIPDVEKIKLRFGVSEKTTLEESLLKTYNYYC